MTLQGWHATTAFVVSAVFLALAIIEASLVLFWLFRVTTGHKYERVEPKNFILRLDELHGFYQRQGTHPENQDGPIAVDMRRMAIDSYLKAIENNRELSLKRYKMRGRAALHLVGSLICVLGATTVILVADKIGYFVGVLP